MPSYNALLKLYKYLIYYFFVNIKKALKFRYMSREKCFAISKEIKNENHFKLLTNLIIVYLFKTNWF